MLSFIILLFFLASIHSKLQCKNSENIDVDWFVVYKWPQNETSKNVFIQNGTGFSYISADSPDSGWNLADVSLNSSDNLVAYTLKPLYSEHRSDDLLWILYNDETPNKTVSFSLGHTKGVVLATGAEGLWLVHSVPRFPPLPSAPYVYSHNGGLNGQSFLCISLSGSQVDKIGKQLKYNEPQVYSAYVPADLKEVYPNLEGAVEGAWVKAAPWYREEELTSSAGQLFKSFAKSKQFKKDLYADWVAPALGVDLVVETWPNGKGRLPSACQSPFKVYNVKSIALKNSSIVFSNRVDHSKWGIAGNGTSQPWICVGDINRRITQEKRSGGTVCMKMQSVWRAYMQAVGEIETCPRYKNHNT